MYTSFSTSRIRLFFSNLVPLFTIKLSSLLKFFRSSATPKLEDLESDFKPDCEFCGVSKENGFRVLLREANVVVFFDRDPAAREHLQVVPIKHGSLSSVKDLKALDIPLLREMEKAGHRALDMLPSHIPPEDRVLGFHIPPFISVPHLHLHVHGLPYKPMRKHKYPIVPGVNGNSKGRSYFVTLSQAIEILEKGGTITLGAC